MEVKKSRTKFVSMIIKHGCCEIVYRRRIVSAVNATFAFTHIHIT